MKAIVVHNAAGDIKSVAFVADEAAAHLELEPPDGDSVVHVDLPDLGSLDIKVERIERIHERLREHARKLKEEFRIHARSLVRR